MERGCGIVGCLVEKVSNQSVRLKLKNPHNNSVNFKGKLVEVKDQNIIIKSKNVQIAFAYDNIKSANLTLTDEAFKQLLKKTE